MTDSFNYAAELLQAGISVFPIGKNKVPSIAWKEYCKRLPTEDEVIDWFSQPAGIGRICGAVSGNLEVIDFDVDDEVDKTKFKYDSTSLIAAWGEHVEKFAPGLIQIVTTIQTPRPGFHVTYRCEEPVDGNQKLAYVPNNKGKWKAIIETRGEGGYALSPCSPSFCHPLGGNRYTEVAGRPLFQVATITAEERNILLQAARSFNQRPEVVQKESESNSAGYESDSPGNEFCQRATWKEILEPHGLKLVHVDHAGTSYWKREGSSNKWSASTGFGDSGLFYAFSPNCGVDAERGYNKFSMFTHLNHAGNFDAASKDLREKGYGKKELETADMSAILKSFKTPEKNNKFPEHLLAVPGIVSGMVDYNLQTAFVKQPVLALAGALAFMGALVGRKVTDSIGSRANVYIIGVADSGRGKEHARKVNKSLASVANVDGLIGPEGFASGSGLIKAVSLNPSQLFQVDEIGRMLRTVGKPGSAPQLFEIITILMKLFTSSDSTYYGNAYADAEKKNVEIEAPNCNLYGTTVPESFFDSLTKESLTDGFMSRLMVFEGSADEIPQRPDTNIIFPESLIEQVQKWSNFDLGDSNIWAVCRRINRTPDADRMLWDFQQSSYAKGKGSVQKALWSRASEKAGKLALIHACSESFEDCEIGTDAAEWAIELSNYLTQRMIELSEEHVSENEHEKNYKRIEKIIKKKGAIKMSTFGQKTRFLPTWQRNQILEDMEEKGLVSRFKDENSSKGRPSEFLKWEGV